ncbi:MAG: uracil-DNA glycosylase [Anaerolineales bacterium]
MPSLTDLTETIITCTRCPRLVAHREEVARTKRRAYADQAYWGKPVPGFGDPQARLLLVGLAPGAHGANRTGRMFTGDRSGDFLYAALYRAGFASQPESIHREDGLELRDAFITAAGRCAPPKNRPTAAELANCLPYLQSELHALPRVRVILALGGIAFEYTLRALRMPGESLPRPKPKFAHGAEVTIGRYTLLGCYHPSQQNTFTGRLTPEMMDTVLARVRSLCDHR